MRIAMASGKGGAGKTTVTASLASVWDGPCLVVDADVEAPNLHLFLHPELSAPESVYLEVPALDKERCAVRSIKERDESLESFYMDLIGGVRHA